DIGSFPYKFVVVEPFSRAAFAMKKGEISDVVTTDFGVHIIKVTDRTQGETTTYATAKDSVREIMAQDLDLYQTILAQQRKAAKSEEALAVNETKTGRAGGGGRRNEPPSGRFLRALHAARLAGLILGCAMSRKSLAFLLMLLAIAGCAVSLEDKLLFQP